MRLKIALLKRMIENRNRLADGLDRNGRHEKAASLRSEASWLEAQLQEFQLD